jgi:hypothetical protein
MISGKVTFKASTRTVKDLEAPEVDPEASEDQLHPPTASRSERDLRYA